MAGIITQKLINGQSLPRNRLVTIKRKGSIQNGQKNRQENNAPECVATPEPSPMATQSLRSRALHRLQGDGIGRFNMFNFQAFSGQRTTMSTQGVFGLFGGEIGLLLVHDGMALAAGTVAGEEGRITGVLDLI